MYYLGKDYDKKSDVEHIRKCVDEIEKNLEALGFTIRVVEVNILASFYEFDLEVAVGTDLQKLEKHDRVLAMALSSPTGKVYWQIPVPGKHFIGLKVPKPSTEYLGKLKHHEEMRLRNRDMRSRIASIFYLIGQGNYSIARRILGIK